jgi:alginate O-acetyltransferase complex protein AlgI
MIFNSYIFWLFFAGFFVVYRMLPHTLQNRFLLVGSYIFYGYWDWRFCGLLAFSTIVDFFVAKIIHESESQVRKKRILLISIITNLTLLGFFKYYNFFSGEFVHALAGLGLSVSLPALNVILPVGLSFYTFQSLSYTIDVYRKKAEPAKNFLDLAAYVSFFPQLVAGPIERASRFLPQFLTPRIHKPGDFSIGLYHVMIGMFKKVIVADNLAPIANIVFSKNAGDLSGAEVLVGIYAFSIQIYCDFSGYSSIAQGIAKWLGFDLMWNFKMPYFAVSPSDFWKRWHISLSSWLRDYLYISLGGNRHGNLRTYRNLMLTMLLGGLWHGARWTFVAWGFFHGLILVIYRLLGDGKKDEKDTPLPLKKRLPMMLVMFHLVCISWLFFRAESLPQVWMMTFKLFTDFRITHFALYGFGMLFFFGAPLLTYEAIIEKSKDMVLLTKIKFGYRALLYGYCVIMLWIFAPLLSQVFIYFQF